MGVTDKEMADDVCASIDCHGHDRCTNDAEWDELKAQQDWVYALLGERDALRKQLEAANRRIAELEERADKSAELVAKAVALMSPQKEGV